MAPIMKRFTGLLNRSKSTSLRNNSTPELEIDNGAADSPEANAPRAVRLFCESGSNSNGGEEVLHLPVIVESAESSPSAAASAALQIRKFLGKDYATKPHVQYNAIMLIRILSDNPGKTFTRNFDGKFVSAVKELLRNGRDPSTQQILRETLDSMEVEKSWDEGLTGLLQMWRKEKGYGASLSSSRGARVSQSMANAGFGSVPPPMQMSGGQQRTRSGRTTQLPSPAELASRVEEAKNTAKILLQLVQSTPSAEVLSNDLIKEFSERCSSASRSMQNYINCDNPAPDHDTMQTLIETNEQLSLAMSRHQRAVLAARRAMGTSSSPSQAAATTETNDYGAFAAPTNPPPSHVQSSAPQLLPVSSFQNGNGTHESYQSPPGPPPNRTIDQENPFADPDPVDPNTPTHYGAFAASQHAAPQPTQSFAINSEPTFAPAPPHRQNTADLENAYSDSSGRPSPILSRSSVAGGGTSDGLVSPTTPYGTHSSGASYEVGAQAGPAGPHTALAPPRPGPGPWHNSDITPSFMGRQMSAADGLTMHGAGGGGVSEIDGYSQVGRRDRDRG